MIGGAHFLLYSSDPAADRAFFRDLLGFRYVDVGHGWLIFKLPPSELALGVVLYLMCDDVRATMAMLAQRGTTCSKIQEAEWGLATTVPLPSGGRIGLYQPLHARATELE